MNPAAILVTEDDQYDAVIIWNDDDRLIAFTYKDGKVVSSRPLDAAVLDDALLETQIVYGTAAMVTRITSVSMLRRW